jgi:hypothetical protein
MDGQAPNGRYLLWLWKPTGYELREESGSAPSVGTEVTEGEHRLRVTKVGPSPLPGDSRLCAYTIALR